MDEKKFHLGIKALVMNDKREVLVLEVDTSKFHDRDNRNIYYWDIPGGRIHEGDTVENTLRREVEEEIGTRDIEISRHFDSFISNITIPDGTSRLGLILFVYICKIKDMKQEFTLNEESTAYKWVPIKEAKKLLAHKYPKSFIEKLDELEKSPVTDFRERKV